jgi:hypothetical protein
MGGMPGTRGRLPHCPPCTSPARRHPGTEYGPGKAPCRSHTPRTRLQIKELQGTQKNEKLEEYLMCVFFCFFFALTRPRAGQAVGRARRALRVASWRALRPHVGAVRARAQARLRKKMSVSF